MRLKDFWALLKDSWNAWSTEWREKRIQPRLRTLRDSRAQFCRRHGHRGKTPRAIFLSSLVLVLHRAE